MGESNPIQPLIGQLVSNQIPEPIRLPFGEQRKKPDVVVTPGFVAFSVGGVTNVWDRWPARTHSDPAFGMFVRDSAAKSSVNPSIYLLDGVVQKRFVRERDPRTDGPIPHHADGSGSL